MSAEEENNNASETTEIIFLDMRDNPGIKKLYKYGTFNRSNDVVELFLNGNRNTPIVFTIDRKEWGNNPKKAINGLKVYGITDLESQLLTREFLNYNQSELLKKKDNNEQKKEERFSFFKFVESHTNLLFKDQFGKLFAYVKIKDEHYEVMSLSSHKFEIYLLKIFLDKFKIILSKEERNDIIDYLQAKAEFNGIIKRLELRVAKTDDDNNTFYYDLTNNDGSVIKITAEGWTIEKTAPILFRRYTGTQLPQVTPISTTDENGSILLDKFIALLNIKNEDLKLLLKCYIISLFIPDISKPSDILHGEQGSAKSSLQELIKMLVDPSSVKTLTFPRGINELIQKLSHNYIAYFDNVSIIKDWISDALCRAVTGSGFTKRKLYSDDDDIIYSFIRCIGINGINISATKADLLDRSIIFDLGKKIPKEERRKKEVIWTEFEIIKSELLGYIFNILVKVMQVKQVGGITISNGLNRMADWEEHAEIISKCLGYKEGEFLRVYQDNINVQIDEAIAASALSLTIIEFMIQETAEETEEIRFKDEWSGTPGELLTQLDFIAENTLKINISKIKSWPKSPTYLSRRLNEEKTNLREKGFLIETGKKDKKGNRIIEIRKVASIASIASNDDKSSINLDEKFDGTENNDNVVSKVASKENNKNQAQNQDFGRYGAMDATLHTLEESTELFTYDPGPQQRKADLEQQRKDLEIQKRKEEGLQIKRWGAFWICKHCDLQGDKFLLEKHDCKYNLEDNFKRWIKRTEEEEVNK